MNKYVLLLFSAIALSQSVNKTIRLLPDTGQTTSYTGVFGEDNDYNINVPSFVNNLNGTISDNVTGLMWQQIDGGEMTIENAIIYADNLVLGGFSDWRLPSPIESFSIINHQNTNPAMDTVFFTLTTAGYWWTNLFEINSTSKLWRTNAGGGIGNHPKNETISAGGTKRFHARCVRDVAVPITIQSRFTNNSDGTITDNLTQLVWQKTLSVNPLAWENAISYAENLTIGTLSDWRLPNIKELQSLNDELRTSPSVDTNYFSTIGIKNYWSSTTLANQSTKSWYWNTLFGVTTYGDKTATNYIICVRGAPLNLATKSITKLTPTVYPNPFLNYIYIENYSEVEKYKLFNNIGQLISIGNTIINKDFSSLPAGIYFLKLDEFSDSKIKIVKQ